MRHAERAPHVVSLRAWYNKQWLPDRWKTKTRRAPFRHLRDARVYGHSTAAMPDNEYIPRLTAGNEVMDVRSTAFRLRVPTRLLSKNKSKNQLSNTGGKKGGESLRQRAELHSTYVPVRDALFPSLLTCSLQDWSRRMTFRRSYPNTRRLACRKTSSATSSVSDGTRISGTSNMLTRYCI